MERLYIFGAGEFAHIAHSYFLKEGHYLFQGFVVDSVFANDSVTTKSGFPVFSLPDVLPLLLQDQTRVFVAISASQMNKKRAEVFNRLKELGCKFASYISPIGFFSDEATIGENVFIFEANVVQNGVHIADNTILWSGNHIGHQSRIASHVFLSSHVVISGFCEIDSFCYFGVNSTVADHVKIARGTLVGAGSLVLKDTESDSVFVGSPAKKVEGKNPYSVKFQ